MISEINEDDNENTSNVVTFYHCNLTNANIQEHLDKVKEKMRTANELILSSNQLTSLKLATNDIIKLEKLIAANNKLREISLGSSELPKLVHLDLSMNQLPDVPKCITLLKNLEYFSVKKNLIKTIPADLFSKLIKLNNLDFSRNLIKFQSVDEFLQLSDVLAKCNNLKKLSFAYNPFTSDEIYITNYFDYLCHRIEPLTTLNDRNLIDSSQAVKSEGKAKLIIEKMKQIQSIRLSSSGDLEIILKNLSDQLDRNEFNVSMLKEATSRYLKKLSEEKGKYDDRKNDEFDLTDADTKTITRFKNLVTAALEKNHELNEWALKTFIQFSNVRKGKWADMCFNLLENLVDKDENLNEMLDNEMNLFYLNDFFVLGEMGPDMKPSNSSSNKLLETGKYVDCDKNIIEIMHRVLKAIRIFISPKYPKICKMIYLSVVKLVVNEIVKGDRVRNAILETDSYESKVKFAIFNHSTILLKDTMKNPVLRDIIKDEHIRAIFKLLNELMKMWVNKDRRQGNVNDLTPKNRSRFCKIIITVAKICTRIAVKCIDDGKQSFISILEDIKQKDDRKYDVFCAIIDYLVIYFDNGGYYLPFKKVLTGVDDMINLESEKLCLNLNLLFGQLFKLASSYIICFCKISIKTGSIGTMMNSLLNSILLYYKNLSNVDNLLPKDCDPFILSCLNFSLNLFLTYNKLLWPDRQGFMRLLESDILPILQIPLNIISDDGKSWYSPFANAIGRCYQEKKFLLTDVVSSTHKRISMNNIDTPLEHNNIGTMIKLAGTIINLLIFLGRIANEETEIYLQSAIIQLNKILNDQGRDQILINCLKMDNFQIKKKVVQCFLYVSYNELSADEILNLSDVLSCSNMISGRLEKIFADTFFLIYKVFDFNFENGTRSLPEANKNIIEIALKILEKNTSRKFVSSNLDEISLLNVSITTFLMNLSPYDLGFQNPEYVKLIHQILLNEWNSVNTSITPFPLEIEKISTMWNVENVIKIISLNFPAYNYISLRLLIHLANLLGNFPSKTYTLNKVAYLDNDAVQKIEGQHYANEKNRIKLELGTFKDFYKTVEKFVKEMHTSKPTEYLSFTNPEEITAQQSYFVDNLSILLNWIMGEGTSDRVMDVAEGLSKASFNEILLVERSSFKKSGITMKSKILDWKKTLDKNKGFIPQGHVGKVPLKNIRNVCRFYMRVNTKELFSNDKDIPLKSVHEHNTDVYAENDKPKRLFNEENVHNSRLRGMFCSAFLRCLINIHKHGGSNTSSSHAKVNMIEWLRTETVFKKIIILADSCMSFANVPSKILSVMDKIIKNLAFHGTTPQQVKQTESIIMISSIILGKMTNLLQKEACFEANEQLLANELAKISIRLSSEMNFMTFLEEDFKSRANQKIMSQDLVNILIKTISLKMEEEYQKLIDTTCNELILYPKITRRIKYFLAVYMSIQTENAQFTLESLFKRIYVDDKHMRKTYIQDLIDLNKGMTLKTRINAGGLLKEKVLFSNECLVCFDINSGKETKMKIVVFSTHELLLVEHFSFTGNMIINSEISKAIEAARRFQIRDIKAIYFAQMTNRVFIRILQKSGQPPLEVGLSLLFKKITTMEDLYTSLKRLKSTVEYSESLMIVKCRNVFPVTERPVNELGLGITNSNSNNNNSANPNANTNPNANNKINNTIAQPKYKVPQPIDTSQFKKPTEIKKLNKSSNDATITTTGPEIDRKMKMKKNNQMILCNSSQFKEMFKKKYNQEKNNAMKMVSKEDSQNITNLGKSFSFTPPANDKVKIEKTSEPQLNIEKIGFKPSESVFLVGMKSHTLWDFLSLETRYIKNPKYIQFTTDDTKCIIIWGEDYGKLENIAYTSETLIDGKDSIYQSCYWKEDTLVLNQMKNLFFEPPNEISIEMNSGSVYTFNFFGDSSYFISRAILVNEAKKIPLILKLII